MNEPVFTPPGFVWSPEAVFQAAMTWFRSELDGCNTDDLPYPEITGDALADAIQSSGIRQQRLHAAQEQAMRYAHEAAKRLRGALYQGQLEAVYSDGKLKKLVRIEPGFWLTTDADGCLESGWYEPWGPSARRGQAYIEPLFVTAHKLGDFLNVPAEYLNTRQSSNGLNADPLKRGRKPNIKDAVKNAMRAFIVREGWPALRDMSEKSMEHKFDASRDTCRKARLELSTETPTE
ncbi:hypothetical protein [Methylobacterium sp. Leaf108]|uniref:hypothetical protein n=1 Tax=Methylobacterium sp. Leaf108 TaxID=1736256 RepID=UPI0012E74AE8|nr:hypothetical protein [Methylobacterium sp. Leaf108]